MIKDQRWPKQFGDFAEQLVMYVLGQCKNFSVAYVDHVGADIFAVNRDDNNKKYAVSVKGRIMPETESKMFPFDIYNIQKLNETADVFGMIPALAVVIVDEMEGKKKIRIFFSTLEALNDLCNDKNASFISKNQKGDICLKFTQSAHKSYLFDNFNGPKGNIWSKYIDYTELEFTAFDNKIEF